MSVAARLIRVCLLTLCSLPLAGCGGGGGGTFDPVQHDLEVIRSDADLETRRRASRNLVGQSFSDEQIKEMMAIAKDEKQDNVIRARIIDAFASLGPERGNDLLSDILEIGKGAPSGSGLQQAVARAADRLSWKN